MSIEQHMMVPVVVSTSYLTELTICPLVASGEKDYNPASFGDPPRAVHMNEVASPNTVRHADSDINVKPGKMPMSPMVGGVSKSNRSFYDRTFTKLEKGSVRGSIFNLVSAALGGGVLSLSYVFVLSGWATGLIFIALGTFAGIWSNLLIAQMSIKH